MKIVFLFWIGIGPKSEDASIGKLWESGPFKAMLVGKKIGVISLEGNPRIEKLLTLCDLTNFIIKNWSNRNILSDIQKIYIHIDIYLRIFTEVFIVSALVVTFPESAS